MISLRYFLLTAFCVGLLVVAPVTAFPTMSYVTPQSGPTGGYTGVTIYGTNFTGADNVKFGNTPALSFSVNDDNTITAMSPAHAAERVNVTVRTHQGTASPSCHAIFTYQAAPVVTGISPDAGPISGGNTVRIGGSGFIEASSVVFGGTPALSYTVNIDGNVITATAPAHTAGTYHVTVGTSSGTSSASLADQYTFAAVPAITGISPAFGPTSGGTAVTINGTAFSGASSIRFGSMSSPSFSVSGDGTSVTAVSPAHTAGTVDVTVVTPGGSSAPVAGDRFTYSDPPKVTAVSPAKGSTSGNTLVAITGSGFSGATAVSFGAQAGTNLTVVSPTKIKIRSPAHAAGTVHVRITGPGGNSAIVAADRFTFVPRPNVTGISPKGGPVTGNTTITVYGTGLSNATTISFGSAPGTILTNTATRITARSPAHSAGTVDVRVRTVGGNSALSAADRYTYAPRPNVTMISPSSGTHLGGTNVTLTGTGFTGATAVTFGTTAGTGLIVNSGNMITITSPPHTVGTFYVRVTTPGGNSPLLAADRFTFT
jgi:hypothetical protein